MVCIQQLLELLARLTFRWSDPFLLFVFFSVHSWFQRIFMLSQEALNHFAVNVGKPIVTATMSISEAGMIDSKEMQNGRVEIVHVNAVFSDGRAEFVGAAICKATFYASPGQP